MNRTRLALLVVLVGFGSPLRAHDPGLSVADVRLGTAEVNVTLGFAPRDVVMLLDEVSTPGGDNARELSQRLPELRALGPQLWGMLAADRAVAPIATEARVIGADNVTFIVRYRRVAGPLRARADAMTLLAPGHRQYATVYDERGSVVARKLLGASDNILTWRSAGAAASLPEPLAPGILGFVRLGVEHIWTGYDHLLFLFGLLCVCGSFRSIVRIVSCFTIAHSLTLGLATLNVVALPSRWVEATIAATIAFVGFENLVMRGREPRWRAALTFCFGLVHGFGFASALRDLGVGANGAGIVLPLVSFNLGVELGQVTIAAAVLPILWRLRRSERFLAVGVPVLSGVVLLAGVCWFIQRTVFA